MTANRKYALYGQAFKVQAHQVYEAMRRDDPVFYQPGLDGETMIWFVTRFEDVAAVLRDDRRFVRDMRLALPDEEVAALAMPPVFALVNNHMLNRDGDDHHRLRALVNKAFTPRIIGRMRPRVESLAHELLDAVFTQGRADLVEAYAFPLPIIVIAELLGVPPADRDRFRIWSDALVTPDLSPGAETRLAGLMQEFVAYLRDLFGRRREAPQDDLISALLAAEEAGDRLSEDELFSMVILLITAGHETTVSLIGTAVYSLLQHPVQLDRLRQRPGLIPTAVEEFLRYESPVERALTRWAAEDVVLGGQRIRRGELVIAIIAAADRDPDQFDQPAQLDIARQPNRHLAFGLGAHYCLGAHLARMEAEIALKVLLRRLPGLRLTVPPGEVTWREVPLFRALESLPVAWD